MLKKYNNSTDNTVAYLHILKSRLSIARMNIGGALEEVKKAKIIFESNQDKAGINKCYVKMSQLYLYTKNTKTALFYAKKAIEDDYASKSKASLMHEELALGTVYFYLEEFKLAKVHLANALQLNAASGINNIAITSIAAKYINLSNHELGNFDLVIAYCKKQLETTTNVQSRHSLYYQLATAYNSTKQYAEAKKSLNNLKTLLTENPTLFNIIKTIEYYETATTTEAGLGNYKKAFEYSNEHNIQFEAITDSINAKTTIETKVVLIWLKKI